MSEIVLFLPGNLFHSNITQDKMERLLAERAGMETLEKNLVPVVFGWQMLDRLLAPDIYDPGPHELCVGSFSHALHSLLTKKDSEWQIENEINANSKLKSNINVTFYPEFAPPSDSKLIPTKYFFLPSLGTRYYDHDANTGELDVRKDISNIQAVRFGSKIGILLDTRSPIRKKWHEYQKDPREGLAPLVDATNKVADQNGPVHIVLLDLETPYVESDSNANQLWLDYFDALKDDVRKKFSPLKPHLKWFKDRAVDAGYIGAPHRTLQKWAVHDIQLKYIQRAYNKIQAENLSKKQRILLAVARDSDVLSVMNSRILVQDEKEPCYKKNRIEILRLGVACLNILEGKEDSLDSLAKADPVLGPRLIELLQNF